MASAVLWRRGAAWLRRSCRQPRGVRSCSGSRDVVPTSERYAVRRLPFARLGERDVAFFERLLPGRALTAQEEVKPFNVDWLKSVQGKPAACCARLVKAPSCLLLVIWTTSLQGSLVCVYGSHLYRS